MPGWAKELAVTIRQQEVQRRVEFERGQQRRKLFHQNAPPVWLELAVILAMDAREFNDVLKDNAKNCVQFERFPENQRVLPERVSVHRAGYVTANLETWLELEMEGIQYRITRRVSHEGVTSEKRGLLNLLMDDAGKVTLHHDGRLIDTEEAAQFMLRPVLLP